jgi:hypothetical protein
MNKEDIFAVHKERLKEFLKSIGLWEPLVKGELKCTLCGLQISIDNIGLIIPSKDKIVVCCSKSECVFRVRELREGKNES